MNTPNIISLLTLNPRFSNQVTIIWSKSNLHYYQQILDQMYDKTFVNYLLTLNIYYNKK